MYYSVSTFGSQNSAIGYATSSTLEAGSWTDHGATGIASSSTSSLPYNAIDGNLILASTTSKYLATFGSFWSGIYQVPVTNGVAASGTSYQVQFQPAGAHPSEGPFVFERSGWYYLFWSEGTCCGYDSSRPAKGAEYKIRVCRSQNPAGPYFDRDGTSCTNGGGTTVLESHDNIYGPGGQGVFADSAVGTVLYYHYGEWDRVEEGERVTANAVSTQSTPRLGMRMGTRSLVGMCSTGRVGGRRCRGGTGPRSVYMTLLIFVRSILSEIRTAMVRQIGDHSERALLVTHM
jgi:beta-xylosidase